MINNIAASQPDRYAGAAGRLALNALNQGCLTWLSHIARSMPAVAMNVASDIRSEASGEEQASGSR